MSNLLENIEDICLFIISGFAIFTLLNPNTGNRYTFRIIKAKDKEDLYFVSVLTGSDNTSSYTYLGTIFGEKGYYHGRKSRISRDAQSAKVFSWFFERHLIWLYALSLSPFSRG